VTNTLNLLSLYVEDKMMLNMAPGIVFTFNFHFSLAICAKGAAPLHFVLGRKSREKLIGLSRGN
jgi:hypothetical protein